MSDSNAGEEQLDNWVFDSLVNFLHGSIWKAPVVGFIEEKSVVFDPDSYNNMTEEKEDEFRKIHDEYKALVDFMLSSFMEDLQVTPEQVEDACRLREHQNKSLPESHIAKVALEQLWAAEDFTAFRRLMTRKNIDLQLQSLELLVAKYGVLSPSLRSGDSEEPVGEDGEDDFLQVVIRYSDQLELFKCDYGAADGICPDRNSCSTSAGDKMNEDTSKNMKLHLSGIQFKNNVAPTPVKYQATLMSSSSSSTNCDAQNISSSSQDNPESDCTKPEPDNCDEADPIIVDSDSKIVSIEEAIEPSASPDIIPVRDTALSDEIENEEHSPPKSPDHTPSPMISPYTSPTPPAQPASDIIEESTENAQNDTNSDPSNSCIDLNTDNIPDTDKPEVEGEPESQLIQLEEAEAAIDEATKLSFPELDEPTGEEETGEKEALAEEKPEETPSQAVALSFDEKTAAEIAVTAPEQRRLLTAVRKALEVNPDESEPFKSIDIPTSFENDEDLQKRREYLRAQRDKLIAMKKQEREKLLLANSSPGGSQSSRPKSARAAQMVMKNPLNMRAASIGSNERSLSARRALADRLKQELIEKH